MATQSPFSLLDSVFSQLSATLTPPGWAIDEFQHRLVLFINHVLMQEAEAQARLARQTGSIISLRWRTMSMRVAATPAGLLECLSPQGPSDLSLTVTEESPMALLQSMTAGAKPSVNIEGDVQLAAEVNWLADHVRWDMEEDLSRVMGDAPAHAIAGIARQVSGALRSFMAPKTPADGKPTV
jgi:ubiquinone biosynthesis protein UbiJ